MHNLFLELWKNFQFKLVVNFRIKQLNPHWGWAGLGQVEKLTFAFTPWIDATQRLEAQWPWPCITSRALPTSTSGPGPAPHSCWLLDDTTQPFRELNDQLWGCWAITANFCTLHLLSGETETAPVAQTWCCGRA